jgi:CHAT domain-containing protein
LRSAVIKSGFSLPRLPETRDEVLSIGELFGYKTNDPNIKLDMDAAKSELLKSNLGNYRFIHFATHGILSGDIPYIMEPAIVLTQPGNRNPEDGFLKMSEILELKLNADIVVLSACKTALGKEIAGEGVVGLSRAFMLAGSKSVIVSLWSVESNSTAVLMKSFYSHLMKPGMSKEKALRLAKQELKNQSLISDDISRGVKITGRDKKTQISTTHPFFWAPFILIGEWE